ncbi:VOC family protein [Streptomyces sp. NPDC001985]|uniref:VOC family protein n=1 Tax=Streptomyces sp. NPDC001985 TaxID=3154406 RepID=UPI003319A8A3
MTEATRHPPGTPCWVSLMVHGLDVTQSFYGELFGWEFHPGPQQLGPYVRALLDGEEVAGLGQLPAGRKLPIAWTPYLATESADTTAETIRCCGGTVGVGPLDAADAGRMAMVSDPAGGVFGLWQPRAHAGTAVHGVPGAPARYELITAGTSAVAKFYETVFGYDGEEADPSGPDVVTLRLEGRPVATLRGVGRGPAHEPGTAWLTYFQVDDADRAAHRVSELGGKVRTPPGDGPFGRTATVADPEGAVFALLQPRL